MFKKLTLAGAAIAMGAASLVPATPAMAQRYGGYDRYERGYYGNDRGYYRDRSYRGYDRRYYNRRSHPCKDGDGGLVIGAVAGRAIDRSDPPRGCYRSR